MPVTTKRVFLMTASLQSMTDPARLMFYARRKVTKSRCNFPKNELNFLHLIERTIMKDDVIHHLRTLLARLESLKDSL